MKQETSGVFKMTREEAIQILAQRLSAAKYLDYSYIDCVDVEALQMAIEALETPERKKGKWLKPTGLSNPICSECHSCPNLLFGLTSKFCPNCGARMEEEVCNG